MIASQWPKHHIPLNLHLCYRLTLEAGAGAKAEAEATRAREQAAANFMVCFRSKKLWSPLLNVDSYDGQRDDFLKFPLCSHRTTHVEEFPTNGYVSRALLS